MKRFEYTNQGAMGPKYTSLVFTREASGIVAVIQKSKEGHNGRSVILNEEQQLHLGRFLMNAPQVKVAELLPIINLSAEQV